MDQGNGTIVVETMEAFNEILDKFNGQMVSPGGAAQILGVSRAYIHQLEKDKKIRVYRISDDKVNWDVLPVWARLLMPKRSDYIYIPCEDIERVKTEMIEKAEARLKKLRSK
jgi:hypothetical protein